MQSRTIFIGAFALVFGVSAAIGVYLLAQSWQAKTPTPETVTVVVAASDISRGQTLGADLLTMREWPKEMVPEGAIADPQEILDRTATIPIVKGDLILESKMAPKGAGRGLAAVIPAGMRAVTIQTPNVATGVAGFILPGNKVDILLTMNNQGSDDRTGGGSTITLLQNVEILAVDQQVDAPQANKMDTKDLRSVTLMVTPAEAARLDLGQNKGTLRLTLRNPTDKTKDFVDLVTLRSLNLNPNEIDIAQHEPLPIVANVPVPISPPKAFSPVIRTLRGTRSGFIRFQSVHDELAGVSLSATPTNPANSTIDVVDPIPDPVP